MFKRKKIKFIELEQIYTSTMLTLVLKDWETFLSSIVVDKKEVLYLYVYEEYAYLFFDDKILMCKIPDKVVKKNGLVKTK